MSDSEEYKKYLKKHEAEDRKAKTYRANQDPAERLKVIQSLWAKCNTTNNLFLSVGIDGEVDFLLFSDPDWIESEPERSQFLALRDVCRQQLLPYKEETIRQMKEKGAGGIMDVPPDLEEHWRQIDKDSWELLGPLVYFRVWWNILTAEERAEADVAYDLAVAAKREMDNKRRMVTEYLPGGANLTDEEKQALRSLPIEKQKEIEQLRQERIKKQKEEYPILKRASEKFIDRFAVLGGWRAIDDPALTQEEKRVIEGLSSAQKDALYDRALAESSRRSQMQAQQVLEKYMTLYLSRFSPPMQPIDTVRQRLDEEKKHKQIRQELESRELDIIDGMSAGDPAKLWRQIATKPEILRLLGDAPPVSDVYQRMGERQLQQVTQQASQDISSATRTGGLMMFAPSGWGKSRLLGRSICYEYAVTGIGNVILDVVGGTIDNVLDKIACMEDPSQQQEVTSRIRYCNMGGEYLGTEVYVPAWPMLVKRYTGESLYTTSQRVVDLIAKTDRNLSTASIQGLNRIAPLLTSIAILLAHEGLPISRSFDLLEQPRELQGFLDRTTVRTPEVWEAAQFLRSFVGLPPREQEQRSDVLRNKLSFLRFDLVSRAMFSAPEPLIAWEEVAAQGLQVCSENNLR